MTEIWKTIPGFNGFYEASSTGRIRSVARQVTAMRSGKTTTWNLKSRIIKPRFSSRNHLMVTLSVGAVHTHVFVHRLVLMAFIGMPREGQHGLHFNDDPEDNRIENLRWGSGSDNMVDRVRNGKHHAANKTHCKNGHAFDEANTIVRKGGRRGCLECHRKSCREGNRARNGHKPRLYWDDTPECRNGHLKTPENTYSPAGRGPECRACRAERGKRRNTMPSGTILRAELELDRVR